MFRVFAVDDEPTALEFVCKIIEKRCPGFQIVGKASNGQECLDQLDETRPDVIFSDIKMPVMDGIALAEAIHRNYPEIRMLLISGHQEFDYARSALKYGVEDYLLKPLLPAAFADVVNNIRQKMEDKLLEKRNRMLRRLSMGERINEQELKDCFPDKKYDCMLVRRNGLPRRFTTNAAPEIYGFEDGCISIFGRDEMERIYLRAGAGDFESFAKSVLRQLDTGNDYFTAVCSDKSFPIASLPDTMKRLYRTLDIRSVLGLTQIVRCDGAASQQKMQEDVETESFKTLEHYLHTGNRKRAQKEFASLMQTWARKQIPQLLLERRLRYVLFLAERLDSSDSLMGISEYLLDDAFFNITSMEEMYTYMDDILFPDLHFREEKEQRMDSREQFERIENYVRAYLAEPISKETISRKFNISQSYISKMFRKYADKSFNTYLTEERMEKACAIMRAKPDMYIKEIAEMVGYKDPFYFSKSFRAYTGKSPREYVLTLDEEQKL